MKCIFNCSKIISNYIDGFYIQKDGKRVDLNKKVNKYNKMFEQQLIKKVDEFRDTIKYIEIIDAFIERNITNKQEKTNYMHSLINSCINQRQFIKALIMALKTYEINQQAIYDALLDDCRRLKDRLQHIDKLVNELIEDYGLKNVDEYINNKYGKSLKYFIISKWSDELDKSDIFNYLNDIEDTDVKKERQEKFDNLKNKVVDNFIQELNRENISLSISISDSLQRSIDRTEQIQQSNRNAYLDNSKINKEENINTIITNDSIRIQKNLSLDRKDSELTDEFVTALRVLSLVNNNELYYVTLVKRSAIAYGSTRNKRKDTNKFSACTFFKTREDAQKFINNANYSDYTVIEICKIVINNYLDVEKAILDIVKDHRYLKVEVYDYDCLAYLTYDIRNILRVDITITLENNNTEYNRIDTIKKRYKEEQNEVIKQYNELINTCNSLIRQGIPKDNKTITWEHLHKLNSYKYRCEKAIDSIYKLIHHNKICRGLLNIGELSNNTITTLVNKLQELIKATSELADKYDKVLMDRYRKEQREKKLEQERLRKEKLEQERLQQEKLEQEKLKEELREIEKELHRRNQTMKDLQLSLRISNTLKNLE